MEETVHINDNELALARGGCTHRYPTFPYPYPYPTSSSSFHHHHHLLLLPRRRWAPSWVRNNSLYNASQLGL